MPHDGETVRQPARRVVVSHDQHGQRLDNFLLRELNLPRTRVYKLIRKGEVRVNRGRAKPMSKLSAGDEVRIPPLRLGPEKEGALGGRVPAAALEALEKAVIYSGDGLRIICKPAGWASQGGTGIRWSVVDAAKAAWGDDWQPAHRLDRATSGCLAITQGRGNFNDFSAGEWQKRYVALVHGSFDEPDREWVDYLRRNAAGQVEVVDQSEDGAKFARSTVRCLAQQPSVSKLELSLDTGRTHQIRVQCASRGYPLLGDERYGEPQRDRAEFQRIARKPTLCLHAVVLKGVWKGHDILAKAETPVFFDELLGRASPPEQSERIEAR